MKITQEEIVERQVVLLIDLDEKDVDSHLDTGYKRLAQRTSIPGFRKGKAPRNIIEGYVGREGLVNESLDFILPDATQRAINTQGLETSGPPSVELLDIEPIKLKATVPLKPHVDLGEYKNIRVEKIEAEVTEKDIQNRIEEMRNQSASWEPVDRAVNANDMVTMNVLGTVGDRKILEENNAVYVVQEKEAFPFPDFHKHLEGAKIGVPTKFNLTLSKDHPDTTLSNQEAHFTVAVSEIKEQKLPDLDDDFAKSLGDEYGDLTELRESVEKHLKTETDNSRENAHREDTLAGLLDTATVELPPLLVEREIEYMLQRRNRFVDSLKISIDDYLKFTGKTEEEIKKEMGEQAVARLKQSHALLALANCEKINVSENEIDEKVKSMLESKDEGAETLSGKDMSSDRVRSAVRESLLLSKAMDQMVCISKGSASNSPNNKENTNTTQKDHGKEGKTVDAKD